jgi:hypothetical protein
MLLPLDRTVYSPCTTVWYLLKKESNSRLFPEKLKNIIYCDPSMPKSGMKYLALEASVGNVVSYDPREKPIDKDNTPQRAWRATHVYELVKAAWAVPLGQWEKLNIVFFYIFCGGCYSWAL